VGWWREDFQATGASLRGRGKRFDEGLKIFTDLLAGRPITEAGEYYDAVGLEIEPLPTQQPFPLWLGGNEKSIARAARYAQYLFTINPSGDQVRDDYRPALDQADAEVGPEGKHTKIACFNYVLVENDEKRLREYFWPRMASRINFISLEEALAATPETVEIDPDDRVMWGSAEECARRMRELLASGVDAFVLDFYYHGLEDQEFGREQMRRFAEEVVPLI
jgi:alkanesulfonate monooxygenase SsuD/methylene tetrahydromethanopterin reductase-like flavin-dependent oxidoreductase (luciferase family)